MRKAIVVLFVVVLVLSLAAVGAGWKWGNSGKSQKQAGWTWDEAALSYLWADS